MDNLEKQENPQVTIKDRLDKFDRFVEEEKMKGKKPKKFKLPLKGKVNKNRLQRGYVTIVEVAENNVMNITREPIIDGTIKLRDTFHAIDNEDILTYKNKPALIIPKKSLNPYNPNRIKNQTYGQKYIKSRMLNEVLDAKKKLGVAGMSIGAIILGAVLIYAFIAG